MLYTLSEYFRLPTDLFHDLGITHGRGEETGFFRFGASNVCYGRSEGGVAKSLQGSQQFDASNKVRIDGAAIHVPFDFTDVVTNLRRERYQPALSNGHRRFASSKAAKHFYYFLRGSLPFSVRRHVQKSYFSDWNKLTFPSWPVDCTVDSLHDEFLRLLLSASGLKKVPFIWFWPDGASNCLIITHDVETRAGRDFTPQLMELDESYGFKASFQVVPEERYEVPGEYVREIRDRGFEFNVHDLNHDGRLYLERDDFLRRAARINAFARKYNCRGFRAGSMYRNQDWYDTFEFSYDMSVPNVAHLDPMRGGCCTVMPYFVGKILELPVTTAQDYTLFHILNDYSPELWKQQLALLRERHGLMSFISHPDYLVEARARSVYSSLLDYLQTITVRENTWAALPGDVDTWWRARNEMRLVQQGNEWEIVGPGKERARVAYACLDRGRVVYEMAKTGVRTAV